MSLSVHLLWKKGTLLHCYPWSECCKSVKECCKHAVELASDCGCRCKYPQNIIVKFTNLSCLIMSPQQDLFSLSCVQLHATRKQLKMMFKKNIISINTKPFTLAPTIWWQFHNMLAKFPYTTVTYPYMFANFHNMLVRFPWVIELFPYMIRNSVSL